MNFTIYPAIDLRRGKVVRLREGDPARLTAYSNDPAEIARRWLTMGATWLHVVNLDGAFEEADQVNQVALEAILNTAKEFGAHVQFGGGIRSLEGIERAITLGVARIVLGTVLVEQPAIVPSALKAFGVEKFVAGIDARDGVVRVHGWKESSGISAVALALQARTLGLHTVIFTDVSRDGLGSGLNIAATKQVADASGLDVIASGGVHTLTDVRAAREANLAGVILGRALYEGTIDLREALKISC